MPLFRLTRSMLAAGAISVLLSRAAESQVAASDSVSLLATTQGLLDAVTSGDSAVWAAHLAPQWLLSDEEGEHVTRQEFLAGLHPLPAGQQGKLTVANAHFAGAPGVVVMSYDAEERHQYYGQELRTTFHITDTYIRRGSSWVQLAEQATALPRPVDGVAVAPDRLADYAGTYGLTRDIRMVVAVRDSGLTMGRAGRDPLPLYALDDQLFVRRGARGFWVFRRDGSGAVVALVNWRDNNAVVWRRQP